MKTIFTILLGAVLALSASGAEIVRGTTLTDGQPLYASDLHNLVDTATVGVQFYNDQQTAPIVGSGYYLLVMDPANQVYRRVTAQTLLYGNTNLWLNQSASSVAPSNSLFLFYDGSNNVIRTITASNLFLVKNLSFAGTNGQILPTYPNASVDYGPTNALHLLVWDTNGVPNTMTLSNFMASFYGTFYTNNGVPWWWTNTFQPWSIYPTNSFTNAWGFWTNFPITSLYLTNSSPPSTNTPTLVDADTVPIKSTAQSTNTTATLAALYQYMAARTPLPYLAKVQFNGGGNTVNVTGSTTASNWFLATGHGMGAGIKAVSFQFSGSSGTTMPTSPQVISNTCYYAITANANNFVLFTNYTDAAASNNPVKITGTVSATPGANVLLYINNTTAYNADAIQLCSGASLNAGHYALCFRTNLTDNLYYFTGGVQPAAGRQSGGIEVMQGMPVTVSNLFFDTFDTGLPTGVACNRVWVIIQPQ